MRRLFLSTTLLLATSTAYSQYYPSPRPLLEKDININVNLRANTSVRWSLGIKGGLGFNTILPNNQINNFENTLNFENYAVGLFTSLSHVSFARTRIEIIYLRQHFQRYGYKAEVGSISVPIVVHLQLSLGVFLNIGAAPIYIMHGRVTENSIVNKDLSVYFKRLGADLHVGLGWEFAPLGYFAFSIEARLSYSLLKINAQENRPLRHCILIFYIGFQY